MYKTITFRWGKRVTLQNIVKYNFARKTTTKNLYVHQTPSGSGCVIKYFTVYKV